MQTKQLKYIKKLLNEKKALIIGISGQDGIYLSKILSKNLMFMVLQEVIKKI